MIDDGMRVEAVWRACMLGDLRYVECSCELEMKGLKDCGLMDRQFLDLRSG